MIRMKNARLTLGASTNTAREGYLTLRYRMRLNLCVHTLAISAAVSEHWYTNGTILGIAGVALAVFAIIVTILLWRLGAPRGLLEYSMPVAEAVVGRRPQLSGDDFQVKVRGNVAQDPHLVTVRLENNGHKDIRSEDFDQKKPLILKLGASILAVLSSPDGSDRAFNVEEQTSEIKVCPALIRRGQSMTINVLTEGEPTLSCDESLADVKVRLRSADTPMWVNHGAISSILLILAGTILVGPSKPSQTSVFTGTSLVSIGLLTYLFAWLIRLRYSHIPWVTRRYS